METRHIEYGIGVPRFINRNALAEDMLEWANWQRVADEKAAEIRGTVLQLKETVTVGTIRATYSKGRKSYQYENAAKEAPCRDPGAWDKIVIDHTTQPVPRTDWREVCKDAEIDDIPFTQSEPSVSLKVIT